MAAESHTKKKEPGVLVRHQRACRTRTGGRCNCDPTFTAWVYLRRRRSEACEHGAPPAKFCRKCDAAKKRKSFKTLAAARGWLTDARKQKKDGTLRAVAPRTLAEEIALWLDGARKGEIRSKKGEPYKPSVLVNYELALRLRVTPSLGHRRLDDVTLSDLMQLAEQLQGSGCAGGTVRNSFTPLCAIYRRARQLGHVAVDPTTDLPLPSSGRRDRAATPEAAMELLEVLPAQAKPIYAAAFFTGLRRGELRALRVRNVDLDARTIDVEHGWDEREGEIDPKSRAGRRRVFLLDAVIPYIAPLVEGRDDDAFVFGSDVLPFDTRALARKVDRALDALNKKRAEEDLAPIERYTPHEARHSFSTWCDHAGLSPDRADRYVGHSSGSTASRYRHLLVAQVEADRKLVDAWINGSTSGKVVALPVAHAA
jgi:integrase